YEWLVMPRLDTILSIGCQGDRVWLTPRRKKRISSLASIASRVSLKAFAPRSRKKRSAPLFFSRSPLAAAQSIACSSQSSPAKSASMSGAKAQKSIPAKPAPPKTSSKSSTATSNSRWFVQQRSLPTGSHNAHVRTLAPAMLRRPPFHVRLPRLLFLIIWTTACPERNRRAACRRLCKNRGRDSFDQPLCLLFTARWRRAAGRCCLQPLPSPPQSCSHESAPYLLPVLRNLLRASSLQVFRVSSPLQTLFCPAPSIPSSSASIRPVDPQSTGQPRPRRTQSPAETDPAIPSQRASMFPDIRHLPLGPPCPGPHPTAVCARDSYSTDGSK